MGIRSLNVSDAVVADIEALARQNGMSLERQIDVLLQFALGNIPRPAQRVEMARRVAAMTPKGVKQTDSVILLREDRSR
jgi:hypothetical protein